MKKKQDPVQFVICQAQGQPGVNFTGTVCLNIWGERADDAVSVCGGGTLSAFFGAVDRVILKQLGFAPTLTSYSLRALHKPGQPVTKNAIARVTVHASDNGNTTRSTAESTDIIAASLVAYIQAINNLYHKRSVK